MEEVRRRDIGSDVELRKNCSENNLQVDGWDDKLSKKYSSRSRSSTL